MYVQTSYPYCLFLARSTDAKFPLVTLRFTPLFLLSSCDAMVLQLLLGSRSRGVCNLTIHHHYFDKPFASHLFFWFVWKLIILEKSVQSRTIIRLVQGRCLGSTCRPLQQHRNIKEWHVFGFEGWGCHQCPPCNPQYLAVWHDEKGCVHQTSTNVVVPCRKKIFRNQTQRTTPERLGSFGQTIGCGICHRERIQFARSAKTLIRERRLLTLMWVRDWSKPSLLLDTLAADAVKCDLSCCCFLDCHDCSQRKTPKCPAPLVSFWLLPRWAPSLFLQWAASRATLPATSALCPNAFFDMEHSKYFKWRTRQRE